MPNLNAKEYISFESIKHIAENGSEFWLARELAPVLEYTQWRNFAKVIDKAILACKNCGYDTDQCFAEVSKTSEMPNGGVKQVGSEVRSTIKRVGGTLPEDMPTPTRSITEIEREQIKKLKKSKNKLMLDE